MTYLVFAGIIFKKIRARAAKSILTRLVPLQAFTNIYKVRVREEVFSKLILFTDTYVKK